MINSHPLILTILGSFYQVLPLFSLFLENLIYEKKKH